MSKERDLLREIIKSSYFIGYRLLGKVEKLLAEPGQEPLSDEEVMRLGVLNCCNEANSFKPFGFARAIEKAHGIGDK